MSSRAKLIALTVVAVLLPTTIMSVIQYRSLHDLQEQTKMAAQENLRQAASGLASRTAEYFHEIGLKTLSGFRYDKKSAEDQTSRMEETFRRTLESAPEVGRVFMVADCTCDQSAGAAFVKSRQRSRAITGDGLRRDPEIKELVHMHEKAMMLASQQPPSEPRYLFTNVPACEEHHSQTYVFYPLLDSHGKEIGFSGVQLDGKRLLENLLPKLMESSVSPNLAFAVHDNANRLVYTNNERKSYQLQIAFAPVFPQWMLGMDYGSVSIDELARSSFRQNMTISVFVLVLLITGITLTLRATAREIRLAEAKSSFVSNVSHELKTPLALIRLFAETLELGRVKTPEKAHEYYKIINNESSRLTQLINNILDFSKIEAGRREYQFEVADAGQIVDEVIRTYEYPIRNDGFDLRVHIEQNLPAVRVDRGAISQAVLNLLNNAVKYSDSVKRIDVSVRSESDQILIDVADQGIGIPASEQTRVFDKFYRISTGLVHDRKGTGLGLTLVKHIVDAHRGAVRLTSAPGKGSRFTIELPAIAGHPLETAAFAYEGPDC